MGLGLKPATPKQGPYSSEHPNTDYRNTNTAILPCQKSALANEPATQMQLKHSDQVYSSNTVFRFTASNIHVANTVFAIFAKHTKSKHSVCLITH